MMEELIIKKEDDQIMLLAGKKIYMEQRHWKRTWQVS